MKNNFILVIFLFVFKISFSQKIKEIKLASPDTKIEVTISISDKISWSIKHQNDVILSPSLISMRINNEELGNNPVLINEKRETINTTFATILYKKKSVEDNYKQLILKFKNDFSIEFKAFNDGVAYRFTTSKKETITVENETVNLNFNNDYSTLIPYVRDLRNPTDKYILPNIANSKLYMQAA